MEIAIDFGNSWELACKPEDLVAQKANDRIKG